MSVWIVSACCAPYLSVYILSALACTIPRVHARWIINCMTVTTHALIVSMSCCGLAISLPVKMNDRWRKMQATVVSPPEVLLMSAVNSWLDVGTAGAAAAG
ncbi:hypothetical protein BC831DRAFT_489529 [Entophlyctis helioformis]|nr:hypothetical protein BC831DRAFT_489529 [Entophlyctis helioformis]